ncbi:transketolase family protein [Streptomyces zingiberis]|uniref:Transketolase family protein n=1 Tax=Streptomyces zingiberis TaxID=2053010 RepID=A0ABX1C262_9ACTN|nr:transketolase C-terminal domain-containing protein [Streptomyces zingiberis]NJQ02032.1 transketolase family protein [Streptomyces zingiberis]
MSTTAAALHDCRKTFAETLIELAEGDPRTVAVCNDSVGSSNLGEFQRRFPDRLVNVGIAEQLMVGAGAGLANGGRIPFVCAAAPFLTGRALEQIKADVAYSRTNVKLCAMSPGFAYGQLGPTHHGVEDFAWVRTLPEMVVLAPADPAETREALRWAHRYEGPVYLRIGRTKVPDLTPHVPFEAGRAALLREGGDVTLIGVGTTVSTVLAAAGELAAEGVEARVLNFSTVKPLDEEALLAAAGTGGIVTVEEANVHGGLGSAVAEFLAVRNPVPMRLLGVRDEFTPTGSPAFLSEYFGIDAGAVVRAARELAGAGRGAAA